MKDDFIDSLLVQAEALLSSDAETPSPDFAVDSDCRRINCDLLEKRDTKENGKGFYAKTDIKAGAILIVSKPLALVMGWELDDLVQDEDEYNEEDCEDESEATGSVSNGLLMIRLCEKIEEDPSIWHDHLAHLFPREGENDKLPAWNCCDPQVQEKVTSRLKALKEKKKSLGISCENLPLRLPQIVRYNCLSVETSPELFSYPGPTGFSALSGTALYHEPSFFNHSSDPNVLRWCIGDVLVCVANRDVKKGTEMCISYIESEVLCENSQRRTLILGMDFDDKDSNLNLQGKNNQSEGFPIIDFEVQQELMSMPAFGRVDSILDLLHQATVGVSSDQNDSDDESEEDIDTDSWFRCDEHNLRLLLALTLDEIGQFEEALAQWDKCIAFTEECLPPADENCVPIRVQAALCAAATGKRDIAQAHAREALRLHDLIFGGGVKRFRKRYEKELELKLRPSATGAVLTGQTALDKLWPL